MPAEPISACVSIAAPPEAVFSYFTRPELLTMWLTDYADIDGKVGGRFNLNIRGVAVRGHYLEVEVPNRLLISWGHAGSNHLPPDAAFWKSASIPRTAAP
jgi:uncharacterized protein YndB with AHSA1/START domain